MAALTLMLLLFSPVFTQDSTDGYISIETTTGLKTILPCDLGISGKEKVSNKLWKFGNKFLTFGNRTLDNRMDLDMNYQSDYNLVILNAKESDIGVYECQFLKVGETEQQTRRVSLTMQGPPKIDTSSSSKSVIFNESKTAELHCKAIGNPTPVIMWIRRPMYDFRKIEDQNNTTVKMDLDQDLLSHCQQENGIISCTCTYCAHIPVTGELLVIHNISRYCGDYYDCVAYNGISPVATHRIGVEVYFKPTVEVSDNTTVQYPTMEIVLECFIEANPEPKMRWSKNGISLPEKENGWKQKVTLKAKDVNLWRLELELRELSVTDSGPYACEVSNTMGEDRGVVHLTVLGRTASFEEPRIFDP